MIQIEKPILFANGIQHFLAAIAALYMTMSVGRLVGLLVGVQRVKTEVKMIKIVHKA